MKIFLAIVAVILLFLLSCIKVNVRLSNDEKNIKIKYLFFTIFKIPSNKDSEDDKEENTESESSEKKEKAEENKTKHKSKKQKSGHKTKKSEKKPPEDKSDETKGGNFIQKLKDNKDTVVSLIIPIKGLLLKVFKYIYIRGLYIDVDVSEEDSAETVKQYVNMCRAVYPATELVSELMNVKEKHIYVHCTFGRETTEYKISFSLRISVLNIIILLVMAAKIYLELNGKEPNMANEKKNEQTQTEQKAGKTASKLNGLMGTTMDKIKEMVDVNTIMGNPIVAGDVTIIPVSKVTYAFGSGGSDLSGKSAKDMFGGGAGAGVTLKPVGFLTVTNGESVDFIQIQEDYSGANTIMDKIPGIVSGVTSIFSKDKDDSDDAQPKKKKKKGNKDNAVKSEKVSEAVEDIKDETKEANKK